jgi:hypothetical protein
VANPRGARPDAVRGVDRYLIKNVTTLRLPYQMRLLTFAAEQDAGRLILRIPKACRLSPDLRQFVAEHERRLRAERV